jgi:hypothetical protein
VGSVVVWGAGIPVPGGCDPFEAAVEVEGDLPAGGVFEVGVLQFEEQGHLVVEAPARVIGEQGRLPEGLLARSIERVEHMFDSS